MAIKGHVTKRLKSDNGRPIRKRVNNWMRDTRKYEAELADGTTEEYYANVIAENVFAQVDTEWHEYELV